MGFEVFDKRSAPLAKAPSVTIQKRGIISMNNAAHRLLKEAESVELLYDRDAEVIALRPSTEPHAYTLRQQSARSTGQAVVSATAFTQYFDIDTSVSRRFKPYEQDDMLCIDLRSEAVEIVGNRAKQQGESDEST